MEYSQPLYSLSVEEADSFITGIVKRCLAETKPDNPASNLPKYRTREETKKILKISFPTLDRYTDLGLIKSHRIGNRILYSETEIQRALCDPIKYVRNANR